MADTTRVTLLANYHGHVIAAEFQQGARAESSGKGPTTAHLVPMGNHRLVNVEVPKELLTLGGPHLHHYFSSVRVSTNGEVRLPKIKVARHK